MADTAVVNCPTPSSVRPGYACGTNATCPSPNGLFGNCRCVGVPPNAPSSAQSAIGRWSCDRNLAPDGYDPYPDCPDEGVTSGSACYLEGTHCIPVTASACFTKDVPLCTCAAYSWKC
jgi:hypothetical protein